VFGEFLGEQHIDRRNRLLGYRRAMTIPAGHGESDRSDNDRVFVLRFWIERESAPGSERIWRARVRDVASGREAYFNSVEATLDHLRKEMASETA
jgi:hypothetical protein